jgi:predicted MPP superfamily phosphohydrolase
MQSSGLGKKGKGNVSSTHQLTHSNVFYTHDVKSALLKAKEISNDNDLILITGSFIHNR